jgi:hypothetical protein
MFALLLLFKVYNGPGGNAAKNFIINAEKKIVTTK